MSRYGREPEAGCEGKFRFATYALAAERAVARRWHGGKRSIEAYRCDYCGGWHVGHNSHRRAEVPLRLERRTRPKYRYVEE